LAGLDRLLAGQPAGARAARAWVFGVGWLLPGTCWMVTLTEPGWVIATAVFAGYVAAAAALVPPGRWRWAALPAALTLAEGLRWSFPFGGVPLATLAISQVAGPLAPVVRVGGALALSALTVVAGVALSALAARAWRPAAALAGVVVVSLVVAGVAPSGHDLRPLRVAAVQGGGRQGTRADEVPPSLVFQRHLDASRTIAPGSVDLVVWPEDVVATQGPFTEDPWASALAAEARRLGAVLSVGITDHEPDEPDRFFNAQVAFGPDGTLLSRYDKVRRVPFGEYVPLRGFLEALGAPVDQVPRDAVAGTSPAFLSTPLGRLAVVISWEVFFGGRARDGVGHGGLVLLNPTNGSSYEGTILQTQQVASSRLRALETGRWVVQAAPTGFSAIVSPSGDVVVRTGLRERRVIEGTVQERTGSTWYVRYGDRPVLALALVVLVAAHLGARRRPGLRRARRARG
jgi:apolipoprotein N-acyltransferase